MDGMNERRTWTCINYYGFIAATSVTSEMHPFSRPGSKAFAALNITLE